MESDKITSAQNGLIWKLINEKGLDKGKIEDAYGHISQLTKGQASALIDYLSKYQGDEIAPDSNPVQAPEIPKKPFVAGKLPEAMAGQWGIDPMLANLFFMVIDGNIYVKSPGLLYMASKKGYSSIKVTSRKEGDTWVADAEIFPQISTEELKAIATMPATVADRVMNEFFASTNGHATASPENVQNKRMHPFMQQLAETRALNRALRSYTGYGGTSYEEMPQGEVEHE